MSNKLISSATMPSNIKVSSKAFDEEKIRFTFIGFLVFLSGVPSAYVVNLVGEIYLTELILPFLAVLMIVFSRPYIFREKLFWKFVAAALCMIIGYLISDIVAGTDSSRYLRAWGRNLFLFIDIIAISIIFSVDRRYIWWFASGLSVGLIVYLLAAHVPLADWKFGYGRPLILLALVSGYFMPKVLLMVGLVLLAAVSIYMDSRSLGGFCVLVAGLMFFRIKKPDGLKLGAVTILRIVITVAVFIILLSFLMEQTQDEFSDRRESSSTGRFVGLKIGAQAVSESPILGYGSWGQGTKKFADMYYDALVADMVRLDRINAWHRATIFRPHSQILQGWMEGGIFAAVFFIYFGFQLITGLKNIVLTRRFDFLSPLYSFLLLLALWNLVMSPYAGHHRITIAMAIAILCSMRIEKQRDEHAG